MSFGRTSSKKSLVMLSASSAISLSWFATVSPLSLRASEAVWKAREHSAVLAKLFQNSAELGCVWLI